MTLGKESACNEGDSDDSGLVFGSGRSLGGGHGNPVSILACRIPWTEELGGLQSIGHQELDVTEVTEQAGTHSIFIVHFNF